MLAKNLNDLPPILKNGKPAIIRNLKKGIAKAVRQQPLFLVIALELLIMGLFVHHFFTGRNFESLAFQIPSIGVMVLGEILVIITAGIDIAVGSVMAFSACFMTGLIVRNGIPVALGIFAGLGSGGVAGLIAGIAVAYFRVAPLIATLATMGIFRGLALIYTGNAPIAPLPPFFYNLAMGKFLGVPIIFIIFLLMAVIIHYILAFTKLGNYIYAIGGNEEAAHLSGVPIAKVKVFVYVASGFLSALGGIIMAARLISAQPLMGIGWELSVIADVVVGGASLFGGVGTVFGACLGFLALELLHNSMNLLSLLKYSQQIIIGAILIFVLVISLLRK